MVREVAGRAKIQVRPTRMKCRKCSEEGGSGEVTLAEIHHRRTRTEPETNKISVRRARLQSEICDFECGSGFVEGSD